MVRSSRLLFIEGMPRVAGPLQPMTPLAGVIGDQIYEQRLTTIDLATNTLTPGHTAPTYTSTNTTGRPTARAGSQPRPTAPATPTGTSRNSIHRLAVRRDARNLRAQVADRRASHFSRRQAGGVHRRPDERRRLDRRRNIRRSHRGRRAPAISLPKSRARHLP